MSQTHTYQSAFAAFHAAIDNEQAGNNKEAYKMYTEGLFLTATSLKEGIQYIPNPLIVNAHKHLLELGKKSIERLSHILENSDSKFDMNSNANAPPLSAYAELSKSLPGIITGTPIVTLNYGAENDNYISPLSFLDEENKRTVKMYQKRIESIMNAQEKANLQLELDRRLSENGVLAQKRHEEWEKQRKSIAEECNLLAQQKFDIKEKMRAGKIDSSDITKQNLYAASLQFHREHNWTKELRKKIERNIDDINFIKKTLIYLLQHASYPLACMMRQGQEKVLHKLTKLIVGKPSPSNPEEQLIFEEHFKNITQDIKEDLFILFTVMQALWEPLCTEVHQNIIIDVLHHLYFASVKPYLMHLLRIILHSQEEKLLKSMQKNDNTNLIQYPSVLNPIISKLHQLSTMHSPTEMMSFLVEILKSFIQISSEGELNGNLPSLTMSIDDLMPKLIHLILISNLSTLPAEIMFLENFIPAKKALGEEGYAVTLLQSVLSYIYNEYPSE